MRPKRKTFKLSVYNFEKRKCEIVYVITRYPRAVASYLGASCYSQIYETPNHVTFLRY
jgi:hypothetical protein